MQVIDLTLPLWDGLKTLPNLPGISIEDYYTFAQTEKSYEPPCRGVTIKTIGMPDHLGTHIDAPLHFIPGGKDISEIPPDYLIGEAVVIDASQRDCKNPLSLELLRKFMQEQEIEILKNDIVLLRCWPGKWGEEGYFACESLYGEIADFFLEKGIKALGIDTLSVDSFQDKKRPVHMKLLGHEILIIEILVNLDKIPKARFKFIALPLCLKQASASPTRAIAVID